MSEEENKRPAPVLALIIILILTTLILLAAQLGIEHLLAEQAPEYRRIEVPVVVNFVRSEVAENSSVSDINDATDIFREINLIWLPAQIFFRVTKVNEFNVSESEDIYNLKDHLQSQPGFDPNVLNMYFIRDSEGLNGIAFPQDNLYFVVDRTSVNEARTAAHEIGHVLGLPHVPVNRQRLMHPGSGGRELSQREIQIARSVALEKFSDLESI